jgi:hypothetical protein
VRLRVQMYIKQKQVDIKKRNILKLNQTSDRKHFHFSSLLSFYSIYYNRKIHEQKPYFDCMRKKKKFINIR